MELLHVAASTDSGWQVVTAVGEVDVASSPKLLQVIEGMVVPGVHLVVDLSGVSFLDSTGLGALVQALNAVTEADGEFRVVVTDPNVLKVFEVTALDEVFELCPTLGHATA
jgi:anti-sigma B factor antagonist